MKIGLVGLGKMGGNMAARLRRHGHDVVGYDRDRSVSDVESLADLARALEDEPRRVVWSMVPAGDPTRTTIAELAELLGQGDLVIDGGNSRYTDSLAAAELLATRSISFVDAGVSGGVWGLEEGYCVMAGGSAVDIEHVRPVMDALVTDQGFAHVGPVGAGHFAKMVHNGVEYGIMQAYAEGYELLRAAGSPEVDVAAALEVWRHGSVVRSWLLDLFVPVVADGSVESVAGHASDSGEGRWTIQEAIERGVATPVIAAAMFARFVSQQDTSPAMQAIAVMRQQFGGHATKPARPA